MKLNLDTLKEEILDHLRSEGFVVFHGYSRLAGSDSFVSWDTDGHPDFREFLLAARQAGVKLVVFHQRLFGPEMLEDARERLEMADLTEAERRTVGRRLSEFEPYEGFTCVLELSFDYQGRVYIFHLSAEWFEDYEDLMEEIEAAVEEEPEEGDESLGGYYSSN